MFSGIVFEHVLIVSVLKDLWRDFKIADLHARLSAPLEVLKVYLKCTLFSMPTFLQIPKFRKVYLKYTFPVKV